MEKLYFEKFIFILCQNYTTFQPVKPLLFLSNTELKTFLLENGRRFNGRNVEYFYHHRIDWKLPIDIKI